MKHIHYSLLTIIIALFYSTGCRNIPDKQTSQWDPTVPAADSLVGILDGPYSSDDNPEHDRKIISQLENMGRGAGNGQIMARALYFKALRSYLDRNYETASARIDSALLYSDSVNYAYDHALFRIAKAHFNSGTPQDLALTLKTIPVFESRKDTVRLMDAYNVLEGILYKAGNYPLVLKTAYKQRSLSTYGSPKWLNSAMVSIKALIHLDESSPDSVMTYRADMISLADSMYASPAFQNMIPLNQALVHSILYLKDSNVEHLRQARRHSQNIEWAMPWSASLLLRHFTSINMDSAIKYRPLVQPGIEHPEWPHHKDILLSLRDYYTQSSDCDSLEYINRCIADFDADLAFKTKAMEVDNEMMNRLFDEQRALSQSNYHRALGKWLLVVLLSGIFAGIALYYVMLRKNSKYESSISEITKRLKTEKNKSELLSLQNDGENTKILARAFYNQNPDFVDTLARLYPSLTNNDLRLACMIHDGLDNKSIANILCIKPESVHKNRYRLRCKFNMNATEDLETFLRNIKV